MDFALTDEQRRLIETARKFTRERIIPVAQKLDEHGTFPLEICKEGWELGLMNAEVPTEYGGLGITCFVLSRDTPGVSVGKKEDKLGQRCSNTTDVLFEDVKLTRANLVGGEGEGFKIAMKTFDRS